MKFPMFVLLLVCHGSFENEVSVLDNKAILEPFRLLRRGLYKFLRQSSRSSYARNLVKQQGRLQPDFSNHSFPCDVSNGRSATRPTSVHQLRPGDIDIVGAIGDSLTVGFGLHATNVLGFLNEHRGGSFVLGGEKTWREYLTIPNILKEFNPKLLGYSIKDSLSIEWESQFNVAEGAAVSDDVPYMSTVLLKRILTDKRVDVKNDWKLISLSIGSNDLCTEVCYRRDPLRSVQEHVNDMKYVLRSLKKYLPRTLVYVVPTPDVYKILKGLTNKPLTCQLLHKVECSCVFNSNRLIQPEVLIRVIEQWRQAELDLVHDPEFHTEDFTVVLQPFSLNFTFPLKDGLPDLSYMSTDCFHVSQKGNAVLAVSLWNNFLEPVGQKRKGPSELNLDLNIHCPTEQNPYIFTKRNSV